MQQQIYDYYPNKGDNADQRNNSKSAKKDASFPASDFDRTEVGNKQAASTKDNSGCNNQKQKDHTNPLATPKCTPLFADRIKVIIFAEKKLIKAEYRRMDNILKSVNSQKQLVNKLVLRLVI